MKENVNIYIYMYIYTFIRKKYIYIDYVLEAYTCIYIYIYILQFFQNARSSILYVALAVMGNFSWGIPWLRFQPPTAARTAPKCMEILRDKLMLAAAGCCSAAVGAATVVCLTIGLHGGWWSMAGGVLKRVEAYTCKRPTRVYK